jgi:type II secretory pathway component PulF
LSPIQRTYSKFCFGTQERLEVYEKLRAAAADGIGILYAVNNLADIYARRSKTHPLRYIFEEWGAEIAAGKPFHVAVGAWIPEHEKMVLSSADSGQSLVEALDAIEVQVGAAQEIKQTLVAAAIIPVFYGLLLMMIIYIVSVQLLPEMLNFVSKEEALNAAWLFVRITDLIGAAPWLLPVLAIALIATIVVVMPYEFPFRRWLDRYPPFSFHHTLQGAAFLMTVSGLTRVGTQQIKAIELVTSHASPWLRARCEPILEKLEAGKALGAACSDSKYQFPSQKIIEDLLFYEGTSKPEIAIDRAASRWLRDGKRRAKAIASTMNAVSLVLVAATLVWIILNIMAIMARSDIANPL